MVLVVKNVPANAGHIKRHWFHPWVGRSPGGRYGNLLQYSCLENCLDRGAWRATVHGVAKTQTQLKRLSMQTCVSLVNLPNNPMITPSLPNLWSAYCLFRVTPDYLSSCEVTASHFSLWTTASPIHITYWNWPLSLGRTSSFWQKALKHSLWGVLCPKEVMKILLGLVIYGGIYLSIGRVEYYIWQSMKISFQPYVL